VADTPEWTPDRGGDVISPDESLVSEDTASRFEDGLAFCSFQLGHVVPVSRDRLGHEGDPASQVRDDQRSMTRRLVFPRPQLALGRPRPARPQGAVYQGDRSPGGLSGRFRRWPESRGRLIDQRRQESDTSRDRGLADIEDLCPDFLCDVIAGVSASHDQCLAEGEFPRAAFSLVPWFLEQFFHAFL